MVNPRLLLCLTALTMASVYGVCDTGWLEYKFYCYYISTTALPFENASVSCQQSLAELAYIDDGLENIFLSENLDRSAGQQSYWIGLQRVLLDIWRWTANGKVYTYNGWDLKEPDGEGDCARMTPYGIGVWRDMDCSSSLKYTCKKFADCGEPPLIENSTTTKSKEAVISQTNKIFYPESTLAIYKCDEGSEFHDQVELKESVCSRGGEWIPNLQRLTTCERKLCQPPPLLANMHYNGSDTTYDFGSVISYNCNEGFRFSIREFNVTKYLTCGDDKNWFGDTIQDCSPVFCQRPVTTNAISNTSLNDEGTVASYTCSEGYKFIDNTTTKVFSCLNNFWQPPNFECIRKRCNNMTVVNASPDTNLTYTGTSVLFTCNRGQQFNDTSTRKVVKCQDNEEWNRIITDECERKRCPDNPPSANGSTTNNWNETLKHTYKYRDNITYTCIADWVFLDIELSTQRNVTCGEDGIWIPSDPGECVGDPIEVVTVYHAPVEKEDAEVYGSLNYVLIVAVLVCIIVFDLSTLGKHIAFMKANLKNDQEAFKKQAEERRKEALKIARQRERKQNRKPKTVINTRAYLEKLAERRAASGVGPGEKGEQADKLSVINEVAETPAQLEKSTASSTKPQQDTTNKSPPPQGGKGQPQGSSVASVQSTASSKGEKKGRSDKHSAGLRSTESRQSMSVFHGVPEEKAQDTQL